MDYQIVSVVLRDGTQFDQVAVVGGRVVKIRGRKDIPFSEDDIVKIIITHDKWDFGKEQ